MASLMWPCKEGYFGTRGLKLWLGWDGGVVEENMWREVRYETEIGYLLVVNFVGH